MVSQPSPPEPMRRTELPTEPWQDLAADLLGSLPSGEYLFAVVDYYSRYFEVVKSVTSRKMIECLEMMFSTHGIPLSLKTDNGPEFISEEFESYLEENDIERRTSTPLWPQANGKIERQNHSLLKALRIAQAERKNWRHELLKFLIAYRSTPHSTTGASPAKLLYWRQIYTKIQMYGAVAKAGPARHETEIPQLNRKERTMQMGSEMPKRAVWDQVTKSCLDKTERTSWTQALRKSLTK